MGKKEGGSVSKKVSEDGIRKDILIMRKETPEGSKKPRLVLTDEGADYVMKLASFGCTIEEICTDIGISEPTMYKPHNRDKFQGAIKRGQANYTMTIRQQAMKIMKGGKGSAAMGIFMCKSVLHMSDQVTPSAVTTSPLEEFSKELKKYKEEDEE